MRVGCWADWFGVASPSSFSLADGSCLDLWASHVASPKQPVQWRPCSLLPEFLGRHLWW